MKPQSHYRAVTESKRGNSFCKIHYSTTTLGINKTTTTTVTKNPSCFSKDSPMTVKTTLQVNCVSLDFLRPVFLRVSHVCGWATSRGGLLTTEGAWLPKS